MVPVGTIIKDSGSEEILFDFTSREQRFLAAKGGRGGKGNSNFATPTNQAPRYAEQGRSGEERKVVLELKLIADIGLVGFPNAGKSTLISVISAAKPKIADYPFTTLEPNLGIVQYRDFSGFTVADIPGIIEGASEGKGLGLQFLRHIERTKALCFLIECTSEDPAADFQKLLVELEQYSDTFQHKKKLIALSKIDLIAPDEREPLRADVSKRLNREAIMFSSATGEHINELKDMLWELCTDDETHLFTQ
jgi:GTP-binding protein